MLVLLLGVGFPRLMVSGGLPSTDEGVFAYFAQSAHASLAAGNGLPDTGTLALYPILVSWVFALHANHIVVLRLVDLAVAFAASWILYDVIVSEARSKLGGALIAAIVIFIANQPIFIQSGFKNSLFAAFVPLFAAMRIAQRADGRDPRSWIVCGALVALSVLLRETFVPFLLVGAVAVWVAYGRPLSLRFILGAGLAAAIVLVVAIGARGGVRSLIAGYRDAGVLYASLSDQRGVLLHNSGIASAKEAWLPLAMAGVSVSCLMVTILRGRRELLGRLAFWLSVALVPLIEPFSKIAFPYHFSVCLPGIAGLSALGWRAMVERRANGSTFTGAAVIVVLAAWTLWPKFTSLAQSWPETRATLSAAADGRWPADFVSRSNYLLAADAIRKASRPHDTLSISGFMFALYPLTGLLPPAYEMSHLTALVIGLGLDGSAFQRALSACPPDLLMTTTRTDWPGADVLAKAVHDSGLYAPVAEIPVDASKPYGTLGGTVFRKIPGAPSTCNPVHAANHQR